MSELYTYKEIIKEEEVHLDHRRRKLFGDNEPMARDTKFGIALSGGGIRSATICQGFLKTLNQYGVLKRADYLSTVSGGGFTGAYIQSTLDHTGSYDELFNDKHIEYMRSRGEYLIPGKGLTKLWNRLILMIGFFVSLLMSWISPAIIGLLVYGAYILVSEVLPIDEFVYLRNKKIVLDFAIPVIIGVFVLHFFLNIIFNFNLRLSNIFNKIETAIVGTVLAAFLAVFVASFQIESVDSSKLLYFFVGSTVLVLLGFLTNPNALSFHRYYRKKLADTFMKFTGESKNIKLKDLYVNKYLAPYPLINTCLNLQNSNDAKFKGIKTNDYFLLSPLFCGSKLTKYVETKNSDGYDEMTLPAATTISAAAINPGMGIYSNKLLSFFTTVFNARLGYWTRNPIKMKSSKLIWWPLYFFYELFSKIGTNNQMLNISDGGHIENLGVMELLRRKCRLIIAVDATADADYSFADFTNLCVRARNELGMEIRFRRGFTPEDTIRPNPSHGYSKRRFAIADVYQLWEEVEEYDDQGNVIEVLKHFENKKVGTLVYVKSAITAPQGKPVIREKASLKYATYKYKIYHPAFPHESTSDQFFDPIQWESYYQLGQYMAAEVLDVPNFNSYEPSHRKYAPFTLRQLFNKFDHGKPLFNVEEEVAEQRPVQEETSFPSRIPSRLGRAPIDTIQQMQRMEHPETPIIPINTPTGTRSTSDQEEEITLEEYNEKVEPYEEVVKDVKYEM